MYMHHIWWWMRLLDSIKGRKDCLERRILRKCVNSYSNKFLKKRDYLLKSRLDDDSDHLFLISDYVSVAVLNRDQTSNSVEQIYSNQLKQLQYNWRALLSAVCCCHNSRYWRMSRTFSIPYSPVSFQEHRAYQRKLGVSCLTCSLSNRSSVASVKRIQRKSVLPSKAIYWTWREVARRCSFDTLPLNCSLKCCIS